MVDSIITWREIHGEEVFYVVSKRKIGGIFVDDTITNKEKWVLILSVDTNSDYTTNVWR